MKPVILSSVVAAVVALAGTAAAEEWNAFSRSSRTVYLADIGSINTLGDDTTIRIARVPLQGAANDYSHSAEDIALRCSAKKSRTVLELEYGPDGVETDRIDSEDAAWEDIAPNSLSSYVQAVACEGARAPSANAASIKVFVDNGRGK